MSEHSVPGNTSKTGAPVAPSVSHAPLSPFGACVLNHAVLGVLTQRNGQAKSAAEQLEGDAVQAQHQGVTQSLVTAQFKVSLEAYRAQQKRLRDQGVETLLTPETRDQWMALCHADLPQKNGQPMNPTDLSMGALQAALRLPPAPTPGKAPVNGGAPSRSGPSGSSHR